MEIALCGRPRSGKTSLWTILTGVEVDPAARPETRAGVARVPDARLDRLSELFHPKKKTYATVTYLDVVALERGHRSTDNPVINALRPADALLVVLRAWDDPSDPHPEGSVDPARDLELLESEMLLADLEVAERRLERLDSIIAKTNRDEDKKERATISRIVSILENETPLRSADLGASELRDLRGYAFLTSKPMLVAMNLPEDETSSIGKPASAFGLGDLETKPGYDFVALSAKIEQEIAALPEEDAEVFRSDLGVSEPALNRLIQASYRLLGQISFFTVGEDECRAWTVRNGTAARKAAGVIHTDIERGFIRAEVVSAEDLLEAGSLNKAKENATLRLEGKEYPVTDGDVMHFRHAS